MMSSINFSEMFPSKFSLGLFLLYIFLFVNQGWLVTKSQDTDSQYTYSTEIAVLLTDAIKLIFCIIGYAFQQNLFSIFSETKFHYKVLLLYFVPASLYCIYNNLAYINLSTYDPTTYFLALQLRVVATGVVFQVIFKKKLSGRQWCSLILLTTGCMLKQVNFGDVPHSSDTLVQGKHMSLFISGSSFLLLAQIGCSCLAGVYNEYLLKTYSKEMNLFLQNIFQYFDSIICIIVIIIIEGDFHTLFEKETFLPFYDQKVLLVVFNNAAIGIVTSFFLRYLNSILKTFASGLELVFTAILSWILFSIPIYMNTIFSIFVVTLATFMYSQSPVNNSKSYKKSGDEALLGKEENIC